MCEVVTPHTQDHHKKANQLTPHSIDISKHLLLSVKGASTRYRIYLEGESKKKSGTEAESQKSIISNDMVKLKD